MTDYFQSSSVGDCLLCTWRGFLRVGGLWEKCQVGRCAQSKGEGQECDLEKKVLAQ